MIFFTINFLVYNFFLYQQFFVALSSESTVCLSPLYFTFSDLISSSTCSTSTPSAFTLTSSDSDMGLSEFSTSQFTLLHFQETVQFHKPYGIVLALFLSLSNGQCPLSMFCLTIRYSSDHNYAYSKITVILVCQLAELSPLGVDRSPLHNFCAK